MFVVLIGLGWPAWRTWRGDWPNADRAWVTPVCPRCEEPLDADGFCSICGWSKPARRA